MCTSGGRVLSSDGERFFFFVIVSPNFIMRFLGYKYLVNLSINCQLVKFAPTFSENSHECKFELGVLCIENGLKSGLKAEK